MTPGRKLKRKYTRQHLNWRVDYDYWHALSNEEKIWLDTFTDEYYRNTFNDLDSVHDLKAPKDYKIQYNKVRHGTVKQQLMYEEYIRRRDILYNNAKFEAGLSDYRPNLYTGEEAHISPENSIVEIIDAKKHYKVAKESKKTTDKPTK